MLVERDRLRKPQAPLELDAGLLPLADRINSQLAQLLPAAPRFQLRVTATDSESLLRALVPHYEGANGIALPVGRHGMGLLSLQTFILLLELGRERRRQEKPFFFVMEEPELHIPPGLQRRLVAQAVSIAEQTICTSHSPSVAAYYPGECPTGSRKSAATVNTSYPTFCISAMLSSSRSRCAFSIQRCS